MQEVRESMETCPDKVEFRLRGVIGGEYVQVAYIPQYIIYMGNLL